MTELTHFSLFLFARSHNSHANSMDDLLGAMLDIDDSVSEIMKWIKDNGGYEKNALYVTADHDHYLTLLPRKCNMHFHVYFAAHLQCSNCLISSSTD